MYFTQQHITEKEGIGIRSMRAGQKAKKETLMGMGSQQK